MSSSSGEGLNHKKVVAHIYSENDLKESSDPKTKQKALDKARQTGEYDLFIVAITNEINRLEMIIRAMEAEEPARQ